MSLLDLLIELRIPLWLALLVAACALLAMAWYRHLLERRNKDLEHRLQLVATRNENFMDLVRERHSKRLGALDEVNAALMGFDHDVGHLLQGDEMYARRLQRAYDQGRDLSRQHGALLGDEFHQAVLRYTTAGESILRSSFVLTNEDLAQLEEKSFDAATLARLHQIVGQRIPVVEARRLLRELDENIKLGERFAITSVAHVAGDFDRDEYREAGDQYRQLKAEILRTVPSLPQQQVQ